MFKSMDALVKAVVKNLDHRILDEDEKWQDAIDRTTWMEDDAMKLIAKLIRLGDIRTLFYSLQKHFCAGAFNALNTAEVISNGTDALKSIYNIHIENLKDANPECAGDDETLSALVYDIIRFEYQRRQTAPSP